MTDGLGWVLAFWLLGDPDTRLGYLRELIADEDVWSRRLALVATATINRGHTSFTIPDLTLELVDRVKEIGGLTKYKTVRRSQLTGG
jgi:hypothetical protein